MKTKGKPLLGVRIVDFTHHAAGPYSTFFLSLLGAECIKIESSQRLDIGRRPHPVYGRAGAAEFEQSTANKLSATLNLKQPAGREMALRLIAKSDIVAESFRPGVMERLGLGYEELAQANPKIVLTSISSSGQFGPDRLDPGYAPVFSALGGLGYLTGYEDGPPVELRTMMDNAVGMYAAMATMAALVRSKRTGTGCHVDVSAREVATNLIGDAVVAASTGYAARRSGNSRNHHAPYGVYPCAGTDAWISICVTNQDEWRRLARAMSREEWIEDPRFSDAIERWKHREDLDEEIERLTVVWPKDVLGDHLQRHQVPAMASLTAQDLVEDAHLRQRGVLTELVGPSGQQRTSLSSLWGFSQSLAKVETWPPELGQHNRYVFEELLGITPQQLEQLSGEGIIG